MKLNCRHCGQDIRAEDMNLDRLVAKCWSCHAVYDFSAELEAERKSQVPDTPEALDTPPVSPPTKSRPTVDMPDGITVEFDGHEQRELNPTYRTAPPERRREVRIIRRWFGVGYLLMIVFACVWDGFLINWYGRALLGGDVNEGALFFPLIHVAVGVFITYSALAGLLNRTVVEVKQGELTVTHGPIPWPGKKSIAVAELDQLFCEEKVHRGKNGPHYTYSLNAIIRGGGQIELLKTIPDALQVLYIEQVIEDTLGIEDRMVAGEFRGAR